MHLNHFPTLFAAVMLPTVFGATIAQRDVPNEIIYLTNCLGDNNIYSSQMNYYSDYANSKALQLPDSNAFLTVNGNQTWEGETITGYFLGGHGVEFTVWGLDFSTPIGQPTGAGSNGYASFTCYREQLLELFDDSGLVCTKLYSCAHSNHIEYTNSTTYVSQETVNIDDAVTGTEALSNALSAFDSGSSTCSDTAYQIGSGCTISFTCTAENSNIYNAMAQYLIQGVGSTISPTTLTIPATCPSNEECVRAPGVFKCCDETIVSQSTFPTSATITAFNEDMANPNNPSIQASMGYSITCPAPPDCNNSLCGAIAGALGAIDVDPIFAILGVLGSFACVACQ